MLERTITWVDDGAGKGKARLIDQTKLPLEHVHVIVDTHERMAESIKIMEIRGAPAIGAAAAMGMALAACEFTGTSIDALMQHLEGAKRTLDATRPTAVNLFWATNRMMKHAREARGTVDEVVRSLVNEAKHVAEEDVEINTRMGAHGAALLEDGDTVLTHCNAGALACVAHGTALGVIRSAVAQGKRIKVISDETRPRLQGATLTCWELQQDGIPVTQIPDNQAGFLMQRGMIDKIVVGSDRIVADAVFNKIGTYSVAVLAKYHGIPFYVAAPVSTIDLESKMKDVEIEQRDPSEVTRVLGKVQVSPDGIEALNYAFDPTPMDLVTRVITEDGSFTPAELLQRYDFKP